MTEKCPTIEPQLDPPLTPCAMSPNEKCGYDPKTCECSGQTYHTHLWQCFGGVWNCLLDLRVDCPCADTPAPFLPIQPFETRAPTPSPTPAPKVCRLISGKVEEDTNNDDEGEIGINGVPVTLFNTSGDVVVETSATTASGAFSFSCVPPGKYIVKEITPPGFQDVKDSDGGTDPNTVIVDVTDGDVDDVLFVDEKPPTGIPTPPPSPAPTPAPTACRSISGIVLEDTDNDDEGDDPMVSVVVTLLDSSGGII